mmetsp:Transcript_21614/g.40034  ORF Transcript_21614/g.40034 Transcript_21614/m.40034 type:complete len:702 (+) Transcript_21614:50-2155(+)
MDAATGKSDDRTTIREVFGSCLSNTATLDKGQLKKVLQTIEPTTWTDERIDALFEATATNDDGLIKLDEMLGWVDTATDSKLESPPLKRSVSGHGITRNKVLASANMELPLDKVAEERTGKQLVYQEKVLRSTSGLVKIPKASEVAPYGNDELYYGSAKVFLAPVAGSTIGYRHQDWKPLADEESLQRVLLRAEKMGPKGDIIVPAIPALDFGLVGDTTRTDDVDEWPEFMQTPLIKVGKNVPEYMWKMPPGAPTKAFASGVRSCIFKLKGSWYRLKGCGNNDEGFTVKSEVNPAGDFTRQIRGSAWLHTAIRENYMAAHLANSMEPKGILGANVAMGAYVYDAPNQPFGPDVSVPACIVQQTHGDRRLGTHVMAGIELILPMILNTAMLRTDALLALFPAARTSLDAGGDPVVSTAALMSDHMMALEMVAAGVLEPGAQGLSFDVPRDGTVLAPRANTVLPYRRLEPGVYPLQWTREGSREMSPEWRELWDQCAMEYNKCLEACVDESVLGYLFSRLGNDCGKIMRGMHDARVSWGTYQDEICIHESQWHCNAHANNVVVLSEESSAEMFLGYLDLDMAFDDSTFVSVYGKGSPIGTVGIGKEAHDQLLDREHINFLEVLAGADTTSGVPMVAKDHLRSHEKYQEIEVVKSVLYDALVLGYLNAYKGDSGFAVAPLDPELHKFARIVIKLAIMVMADYIA